MSYSLSSYSQISYGLGYHLVSYAPLKDVISNSFYAEMLETANELLDEFGTFFNIRTKGTYDPLTLEGLPGASREVFGLVWNQSNNFGNSDFNWFGRKVLLLKADSNPEPEEEVYVGAEWFSLSKISAIKPGEVVLMYILDLEK